MTIDLPSASFVYPPKARLAIKWLCSRPQAGCQRCTQRFTAGSSSLTEDLSRRPGRISNHAQDALITTGPGTRYSRSLVLPPIDKIGNALFYVRTPQQCALLTFSEEALDFSEEILGIFLKKVPFQPKSYKSTFSEEAMESGTFSDKAMDFSEQKIGFVGNFALIPFRGSAGNPKGWDFRRNWREISLFIVIVEKVRRQGQSEDFFSGNVGRNCGKFHRNCRKSLLKRCKPSTTVTATGRQQPELDKRT